MSTPNEYDSRDGPADVGAGCGPSSPAPRAIPAGARFLSPCFCRLSPVVHCLLARFGLGVALGKLSQPTKEEDVLAIAGTGYGLIGLLVIILLVVLIFYFLRRA